MSMDDDVRAIEKRHAQDAPWFTGGLHDPNGYVAMAHKDRGELLKIIEAQRNYMLLNKLVERVIAA